MCNSPKKTSIRFRGTWLCSAAIVGLCCVPGNTAETKVSIVFSGGHETDRKDGGRPVVLVAAALDVTPDVFRTAFSAVTPARDGRPSPDEARSNKAALMKVLKPLGVTNDRLDEVSNYYRYRPQSGKLWTNTPAEAYAVVSGGAVKEIVVTAAGSGYSTPPKAQIEGMEAIPLKVTLQFGKDFKKNGAVSSIEAAAAEAAKPAR